MFSQICHTYTISHSCCFLFCLAEVGLFFLDFFDFVSSPRADVFGCSSFFSSSYWTDAFGCSSFFSYALADLGCFTFSSSPLAEVLGSSPASSAAFFAASFFLLLLRAAFESPASSPSYFYVSSTLLTKLISAPSVLRKAAITFLNSFSAFVSFKTQLLSNFNFDSPNSLNHDLVNKGFVLVHNSIAFDF